MRVLTTGGTGFLGQHVIAELKAAGHDVIKPFGRAVDLRRQRTAEDVIGNYLPEAVVHMAASVGGIQANQRYPATYFRDNMLMGLNMLDAAARRSVKRFVLIGTVCSYPKFCDVPFREEDLFAGYPEETNAPYGVSKRALSVALDGYRKEYKMSGINLIPANLYGPGDCLDDARSHVIPALIKRFLKGESVTCWGDGSASRDFLFVRDAAKAICAAVASDVTGNMNVGTGRECTIRELVELIADATGFAGEFNWDTSKPNGQPRRAVSADKAEELLGWRPETSLEDGLAETVEWIRTSL